MILWTKGGDGKSEVPKRTLPIVEDIKRRDDTIGNRSFEMMYHVINQNL